MDEKWIRVKAPGRLIASESVKSIRDRWNYYSQLDELAGVGSTPEEAVARLWLELNRKA